MNGSSSSQNLRSLQRPELVTRSPFATATRRPTRLHNVMPMRADAAVLMKLWVDLKSKRAVRRVLYLNVELHNPA
jgi:hypothetical protein